MSDLTPAKKNFLETEGHLLAMGGPGCGKTYVALLKARREIDLGRLRPHQRVLFLSFARATVAQVAQQAGDLISAVLRSYVETNTYHGFAWNIVRSHGYLLAGRRLTLISPPAAASRLADVAPDARPAEIRRLRDEEGLLHFDLFAATCAELLSRSRSLGRIVCDTYPTIIFDEFQDTNADEWQLIQSLGRNSRLIGLADPEQRIYEFRGADPKRIGEFIQVFTPAQFDFSAENHRSDGTDIVPFGNDLLAGSNKGKPYKDVSVVRYGYYHGYSPHFPVKAAVLEAMRRCKAKGHSGWSIAILVPSKRFMLAVSDYLASRTDNLPTLSHDVALDSEGPALAAVVLAGILDQHSDPTRAVASLIRDLCNHMRGRRGSTAPTQTTLKLTEALTAYLDTGSIRGKNRLALVADCQRIAEQRRHMTLTGNPENDWLSVRQLCADSPIEHIQQIAEDAKYLRLLHRGAILRARLGELWRANAGYPGVAMAVHDALLQEHFSASTRKWQGLNLMTIHKSKGKQFDEVVVYEGVYQGRLIRPNATVNEIAQARLSLRVAVTRATTRTTILTPQSDPCAFL